jgi:hypothetical protein
MTEGEWLAANDPEPMLDFLRGKASERKLRLFAVACCRVIWGLFDDRRSQEAVEQAERYADGKISLAALQAAERLAEAAAGGPRANPNMRNDYPSGAARIVSSTLIDVEACVWATREACIFAREVGGKRERYPRIAVSAIQSGFLRCIFGNPFRPVSVCPEWLTSTVLALAEGIYQDRAFDRMPILADALQDAGCDNTGILDYCRNTSLTHVRGCWVIDLLTGRV